ncbi:MAG: hypothetical protein ACE5HO_20790 [bacterium]
MIKRASLLVLLLPCLLGAQEKRWLRGEVLSIDENGKKIPHARIQVNLKEPASSDRTNEDGIFRIFLPDAFKPGERVTVEVKEPGWGIQYPLEGETRIPADLRKELVEIRLLPLGSLKWWKTPGFIEKFVEDVADKSKQQVTPEGKPEDIDFGPFVKDWANKYGFSAEQAQEQIDKWIAEVEEYENEITKLGLAAFARKNFARAGELFKKAAETKETRLKKTKKRREQFEQKEERLREDVVKNYRLAGDSHYNNYRFDKALTAYQKALRYVSKENDPQHWFDLTLRIGTADWQTGIRTTGPDIREYLTAALDAYQRAAGAFSREEAPERWAATQVGVGLALSGLGSRTGGEAGAQLLGQAVEAYEKALEVRTRATLPQDWAATQNNLGNVLAYLGIRTDGEAGVQLLTQAVEAFQKALKVRTLEHLPQQWAQTQNNLARANEYLQDWSNAAACYANVLEVKPDCFKTYQKANFLYHVVVFDFSAAFALNQSWLARHPQDLSAQSDFAEEHFTTGRFAECKNKIAELLENPEVEVRSNIALRAIQIANLLALNQAEVVAGKLKTLISNVSSEPDSFKARWSFAGTKHFISNSDNENLLKYRTWLLQIFQALEGENRAAILAGLREAQANFMVVPGKE